ncbi:MAG: substrate-binding domain-containing protein [Lentisphaerota bacterium]
MRKSSCRTDETLRRLEKTVKSLRDNGEAFLPSERILCELVGTSRMTIRKALEVMESQGSIETGRRGRIIVNKWIGSPKGKVAFVSTGSGWIRLPAWNRLWGNLESLLKANGYELDVKLYSDNSTFDPKHLESYDFIIISSIPEKLTDDFAAFMKDHPGTISTYHGYSSITKYTIVLDNYAAGRIAGNLIIESGYKKPAFLGWDNGYLSFKKREAGFFDTLEKANPKYEPPRFLISAVTFHGYIKGYVQRLDEIGDTDIDSIFIYSDEMIGLSYDQFAWKYKIPDEFGIVTVDGSREAAMHHPPICSIGHGTPQIALGIYELIEKIREGKCAKVTKLTLVEPEIHEGATLRKTLKQEEKR